MRHRQRIEQRLMLMAPIACCALGCVGDSALDTAFAPEETLPATPNRFRAVVIAESSLYTLEAGALVPADVAPLSRGTVLTSGVKAEGYTLSWPYMQPGNPSDELPEMHLLVTPSGEELFLPPQDACFEDLHAAPDCRCLAVTTADCLAVTHADGAETTIPENTEVVVLSSPSDGTQSVALLGFKGQISDPLGEAPRDALDYQPSCEPTSDPLSAELLGSSTVQLLCGQGAHDSWSNAALGLSRLSGLVLQPGATVSFYLQTAGDNYFSSDLPDFAPDKSTGGIPCWKGGGALGHVADALHSAISEAAETAEYPPSAPPQLGCPGDYLGTSPVDYSISSPVPALIIASSRLENDCLHLSVEVWERSL